MELTSLPIFFLATWRVANLLVSEKGPFNIFIWIRERAGIVHDESGEPYQYPDNFFSELLSCVWCTSVWVACGWWVFWLISPEWSLKLAIPFAFSAGAILIDKYLKG